MSLAKVEGPAARTAVDASRSASGWVARVLESDGRGILRMLWRILGKEADVLDAYQDCFCRLAAYPNGKDLASARAFAYRTASNVAIEMIRVRKRREAHLPAIAQTKTVNQVGAESGGGVASDSEESQGAIADSEELRGDRESAAASAKCHRAS